MWAISDCLVDLQWSTATSKCILTATSKRWYIFQTYLYRVLHLKRTDDLELMSCSQILEPRSWCSGPCTEACFWRSPAVCSRDVIAPPFRLGTCLLLLSVSPFTKLVLSGSQGIREIWAYVGEKSSCAASLAFVGGCAWSAEHAHILILGCILEFPKLEVLMVPEKVSCI